MINSAGLLAFLAAVLIGWKLAASSAKIPEKESVREAAHKKRDRPARESRSAAASAAGKRMASIRAAGTKQERIRAATDLANSLSPAEFAAWMDGGWFDLRGGAELMVFTKIVMERWEQEDPEGLLLRELKSNRVYSNQTLENLAESEPQRLLEFFKKHPDPGWELQVLKNIARSQPELALQRIEEMMVEGIPGSVREDVRGVIDILAWKSPAALAAALDGFWSVFRRDAEVGLSRGRMVESFPEEFRRLRERPDGLQIFLGNSETVINLDINLLPELANLPPAWRFSVALNSRRFIGNSNAAAWCDADLEGLGFSVKDSSRIRFQALMTLGLEHPEEAVRRMDGVELEKEERLMILRDIVRNIIDPEKAAAFVAGLGTEEERAKAAEMIRPRKPLWEEEFAKTSADWLSKVGELDPLKGDAHAYFSQLRSSGEEKVAEVTAGFNALPADKKQQVAQVIAKQVGNDSNVPHALAGDALRYLIANPPAAQEDDARISVGTRTSTYVTNLAEEDPAAAGDWVLTLPASEAKTWAQKNLISHWKQYDPKAADRWEKSLPAADRAALEKIRATPPR